MDKLEKHHHINMLFAYYGSLLTDKQRSIMHYYFEENFTLAEIADNAGISRNAVHDQIQKTIKKLEDYEANLALLKKSEKRQDIIESLKEKTSDEATLALIESLEKVD